MNIVAIQGSLRDRAARHLMDLTSSRLVEKGAAVESVYLRDLKLPFCDGSKSYPEFPDVVKLQEAVSGANGLLVVSPEYHGSLTGVLKNAVDLIDYQSLGGKVIALMSVLGGEMSSNALNHMRHLFRHLHCWVLPDQVGVARAEKAFDESGSPVDPRLAARIDKFAGAFIAGIQKINP